MAATLKSIADLKEGDIVIMGIASRVQSVHEYAGDYGVTLLDGNGEITSHYLPHSTKFQTFEWSDEDWKEYRAL